MISQELTIAEELDRHAKSLSAPARTTLLRMYAAGTLDGTESKGRTIGNERISIYQGAELHRILLDIKAKRTLEVGFAYGYSTIWMLDAVSSIEGGFHEAVDPFEKTVWDGVGLQQVIDTGDFSKRFKWHENYSVHALSALIQEGAQYDGVFIDGNHRFDDVLVDFYLADQLLRVGGVISFDDLWMDSIKSVISFIENNRAYVSVPCGTNNVFRKTAQDNRDWRHYAPFRTVHDPAKAQLTKLTPILRKLGLYEPAKNLYKKWLAR